MVLDHISGLPHEQDAAPSLCTRHIVGAGANENAREGEDEGSFRCWAENHISKTALLIGGLEPSEGVVAAQEFGYQRMVNMIVTSDFSETDGRTIWT